MKTESSLQHRCTKTKIFVNIHHCTGCINVCRRQPPQYAHIAGTISLLGFLINIKHRRLTIASVQLAAGISAIVVIDANVAVSLFPGEARDLCVINVWSRRQLLLYKVVCLTLLPGSTGDK